MNNENLANMKSTDPTDPNGKIDTLDALPPQIRMPMLEDCLDTGLKFSSELAQLIESAVQESSDNGADDADTEAFESEKLNQWIKEAGK